MVLPASLPLSATVLLCMSWMDWTDDRKWSQNEDSKLESLLYCRWLSNQLCNSWATTVCHLESPGKSAEVLLSRSLSLGFWGEEKPWAGESCYLFRAWGLPGLVRLVGKNSPSRPYPSLTYLGTWQDTHCVVSQAQAPCITSPPKA